MSRNGTNLELYIETVGGRSEWSDNIRDLVSIYKPILTTLNICYINSVDGVGNKGVNTVIWLTRVGQMNWPKPK